MMPATRTEKTESTTARRCDAAWEAAGARRVDGLLVSHLPNIRYLTGFSGSNALLLLTVDSRLFFTDSRYDEQAAEEVESCEVNVTGRGSLTELLVPFVNRMKLSRLGFESAAISFAQHRNLRSVLPGVRLLPVDGIVENLRMTKSAGEIDALRRAAAIADTAFRKLLRVIKESMTENDAAAELSWLVRRGGADGNAFEPIVLFGERTSLIHGMPGARKLRPGDAILLDFGAVVRGYHSDLSRTVAFGALPRRLRALHARVLRAQRVAVEAIEAGRSCKTPYRAVIRCFRESNCADLFTHALGHGLGYEVHEAPLLSGRSAQKFRDGNVVTVEPGLYLPGEGGVRIEDDIVVRAGGNEFLTASPRELIIL